MMIGTPKEPGTPSRGKADYGLGWGSFWVYDSWVGRLGLQYAVTRGLGWSATISRKLTYTPNPQHAAQPSERQQLRGPAKHSSQTTDIRPVQRRFEAPPSNGKSFVFKSISHPCYDPRRCEDDSGLDFTCVERMSISDLEESEEQMGKKKGDPTNPLSKKLISASMVMLLGVSTAPAQSTRDPLKRGFENPPQSARPRVWWHWMNGNITQEGIKLDLEWMHRIGLGGFQNFDAALSTPQVVEHRLAYMTPEWKDAFKYATVLADQLGLEEAIAGSPGWSESGGPWVPASQGMKKYVWSETFVEGGKPFTGALAHPPSNTGAFQNLAIQDLLTAPEGSRPIPQFYADTAVIAYRAPPNDSPIESLRPKVTASAGTLDVAMLSDGDLEKAAKLPGSNTNSPSPRPFAP